MQIPLKQFVNFSGIWTLAVAEMRSCRRLARTWLFITIACVSCILIWLTLQINYLYQAEGDPQAALSGPRFASYIFCASLISIFSLGIVFLAFDIRSRDRRDRIAENMDIQPVSTLELLTGRLLGIILLLGIPSVAVFGLMVTAGWVSNSFGFSFPVPIASENVVAFLVWDLVPNLMLWGALTIFLSIVVRWRVLVVLVVLSLMVFLLLVQEHIPSNISGLLSTVSAGLASEIAPRYFEQDVVLSRLCLLLASAGLLFLAAALHPRLVGAGKRIPQLGVGSALITVGILGIWGGLWIKQLEHEQFQQWKAVHEAQKLHSATDIEKISGTVEIRPGNKVRLELQIDVSSWGSKDSNSWVFSLNPGYHITNLQVNGTQEVPYDFQDGLLVIPKTSQDETAVKLHIEAVGKPNLAFALLDSTLDQTVINSTNGLLLQRMGSESSIFHSQYVALLPATSWLPASGSAFGRQNWAERPRDFFELDIKVSAPRNWTIAGPGLRENLASGQIRFRPRNPVPEVALIGANFVRGSLTLDGIEFEVLMSRKHANTLRSWKDATPAIAEWIKERLAVVGELGLVYPYRAVSVVEVPMTLRVYGGGWRMDSVLAPHGIQMIRETGFPTTKFGTPVAGPDHPIEGDPSKDDLIQRIRFIGLRNYFGSETNGGNPLINFPKNFVAYQTMPTGPSAIVLDHMVLEISKRLITEESNSFAGFLALFAAGNVVRVDSGSVTISIGVGDRSLSNSDRIDPRKLPAVYEQMSRISLNEIDYLADPRMGYRILSLKVNAIVDSILDKFGKETVAAFLSELVQRYRGEAYTEEQFFQTALELGIDFHALHGDFLRSRNLPGFIVAEPHQERIADDDSGSVYQASFVLRNDEAVPGHTKIYQQRRMGDRGWNVQYVDSVTIDANTSMRISIHNDEPFEEAWVEPILAHNQSSLLVEFPELSSPDPSNTPKLPLATVVDWSPLPSDAVIVDDLDDGFSFNNAYQSIPSEIPQWISYFGNDEQESLDNGMTRLEDIFRFREFRNADRWVRDSEPSSYGKYRKTYALTFSTHSRSTASFVASLPSSGLWELEYHIPHVVVKRTPENMGKSFKVSHDESRQFWMRPDNIGVHTIRVVHDGNETTFEHNPANFSTGWQTIGQIQIENTSVEVVLDRVEGGAGIADAIKWSPADLEVSTIEVVPSN